MNSSLVKSIPQGEFAEISALVNGWETHLQQLARRKSPIKFDVYPMSRVPSTIVSLLEQQGYHDLILENDRWQHFLLTEETPHDRALNPGVLVKPGIPKILQAALS